MRVVTIATANEEAANIMGGSYFSCWWEIRPLNCTTCPVKILLQLCIEKIKLPLIALSEWGFSASQKETERPKSRLWFILVPRSLTIRVMVEKDPCWNVNGGLCTRVLYQGNRHKEIDKLRRREGRGNWTAESDKILYDSTTPSFWTTYKQILLDRNSDHWLHEEPDTANHT